MGSFVIVQSRDFRVGEALQFCTDSAIGLTPSQYSSGEVHRQGGISKKGSKRTRYLLVEAANALVTRCKVWSKLKAWGIKLQKKKGNRKAIVAVARKLAVIMHKMLVTRKPFERSSDKKELIAV
jgi:Transposase IS116/IS110/IS902 family